MKLILDPKQNTLEKLFPHEVHYGLSKKDHHQSMIKYLDGYRNNIGIFNLKILLQSFRIFSHLLSQGSSVGPILFVTKNKFLGYKLEHLARKYGHYYTTGKWINGLLTNFGDIKKNMIHVYGANFKRRKRVLVNTLGISSMNQLPTLIVMIGMQGNNVALKEANKMNIPVLGFASGRENSSRTTHCIPSNLNSEKALYFYYHLIEHSIEQGELLKNSQNSDENF